MKKNGFTLVEIISVIVVLGIIVSLATMSVLNILEDSRTKTNEYMEGDALDAALTYGLDKLYLTKCPTSFDPNSLKETECSKLVTIKYLKDNAYFADDNNYCQEDSKILIYNDSGEYKVHTNDHICTK